MTDPKRYENLRARAALLGVELRSFRTDAERWAFVVNLGALTQELATLDDVEGWLSTLPRSEARLVALEGTNA